MSKEKIEELNKKLEEMENNWKRALADYKNLENRMREERERTVEFANLVLIEKLISVLDNFDMLEQHTNDMGLKLSVKELKQVLENAGVTEVKVTESDEFDHEFMEAIEMIDGEKNKVMQVIRKAYKFKNKLVRPAGVKVGKGE